MAKFIKMSIYVDLNQRENEILKCKKGILLDTNVWLFLQNISISSHRSGYNVESYSRIYKKILENDIPIYTSKTIISEYINSAIRIEKNNYYESKDINPYEKNYKKDFAKTNGFEDKYQTIIDSAKQDILDMSLLTEISENMLNESLKNCEIQDFNDQIIINTALENNLGILTDDKDYIKYCMNHIGNCPTIYSFNK